VDLARRGVHVWSKLQGTAVVPFRSDRVADGEVVIAQAFRAVGRVERVRVLLYDAPEELYSIRVAA